MSFQPSPFRYAFSFCQEIFEKEFMGLDNNLFKVVM